MDIEQFLEPWRTFRDNFPILKTFLINISAAIIIFVLGIIIARLLRRKIRGAHLIGTSRIDTTLRPVIASIIYYTILGITIYAVLRRMGIEPTVLLAVFGAAGLAIGLALKDTLGNIAAGFMLLILRPLKVGEFIDTSSGMGTVQEVGLFTTTIKNIEGVYIYIPNGQLWNNRIQNFNRHTERKLIIDIGVGYDADLEATQELLVETMQAQSFTLNEPEAPHVFVNAFGDSAITLSCRSWLPAANWLGHASAMRIALKRALDDKGIEIPFPQRVVTTRQK